MKPPPRCTCPHLPRDGRPAPFPGRKAARFLAVNNYDAQPVCKRHAIIAVLSGYRLLPLRAALATEAA